MIIRMCLQVPIGTCFLSKSKFLNHHTKLLNFGYLSQIRWVTIGSRGFKNALNKGFAGCRIPLPQPKESTALKGVVFFFCFIKAVKGF